MSKGCKTTSCQSWRMILSSGNRTQAALVWCEVGCAAGFFSDLQLWQSPKAGFKFILWGPFLLELGCEPMSSSGLKMAMKSRIFLFSLQFCGCISKFFNICLRSYNKSCHIKILTPVNKGLIVVKLSNPQIRRSSGLFFISLALPCRVKAIITTFLPS